MAHFLMESPVDIAYNALTADISSLLAIAPISDFHWRCYIASRPRHKFSWISGMDLQPGKFHSRLLYEVGLWVAIADFGTDVNKAIMCRFNWINTLRLRTNLHPRGLISRKTL